jgi:uncharacterized membrane protein YdjX (TVP38/TMEM64 family)
MTSTFNEGENPNGCCIAYPLSRYFIRVSLVTLNIMNNTLRVTFVILLALAVPLIPFAIIGELPGERWLSARDANALEFALTGSALLAADVLLPIPSSIVGSLLGARLGFWWGFAACFVGLMTGQLGAYAVARLFSARLRLQVTAEAPALAAIFLSRPVPVFAEAVVLVAGATRVAAVPFVLACGAGNAIYAAVLAANGATLLPGDWTGPGLIVPMLLAVAAWLLWQRQRRAANSIDRPS